MPEQNRSVDSLLCNATVGAKLYARMSEEQKLYSIAVATCAHAAAAIMVGLICEGVDDNPELRADIDEIDDVAEIWGLLLVLARSSLGEAQKGEQGARDVMELGTEFLRANLNVGQ